MCANNLHGCLCRNVGLAQKSFFQREFFFLIFLSHRHIAWVSINYAWQKHVFPVTLLSHIHSLVTAMWQEKDLPVTHNMLIYNKYDGVIGKTRKNFFCKAEIHRKTKSLSRFFFDVRSWQLQFKSNSPPIQVQFKSNTELVNNCLCDVIAFSEHL